MLKDKQMCLCFIKVTNIDVDGVEKMEKKSVFEMLSVCTIVSIFIIAITIWNYYPQSGVLSVYSDTKCHAEWATGMYNHTLEGYGTKANSYPLFFWMSGFIGHIVNSPSWGIVTVGAILSLLSFYVVYFYIRKKAVYSKHSSLMAALFSLMISYAWPIDYMFKIAQGKKTLLEEYLTAFCTNPAHNLTALAPKAFSLIVIILFIECFKVDNTRKIAKYAMVLALCFFISVLLKPSFYQFFSFTGTIIVIVFFLKKPSLERFKFSLIMAVSFIPATMWVIHGTNGGASKFEIEPFTVLYLNNPTIMDAVKSCFIGTSFCTFVLIIGLIKKYWSIELTVGWLGYLVSILQFILIIEPEEISSMNMAWGVMMAMYILFTMSYVAAEQMYYKKVIGKYTIYGLRLILIWHGLCGIYAHLHWADGYRAMLGW